MPMKDYIRLVGWRDLDRVSVKGQLKNRMHHHPAAWQCNLLLLLSQHDGLQP